MKQHDPAEARQGEIVGKPTMLAKFEGMQNAERILESLKNVGYPLDDVSVLFRIGDSDQVIDLLTGHVAAGQSLTDEEIKPQKLKKGQTLVLLHPHTNQLDAVQKALSEIGALTIEYASETHAYGRPGGAERYDEPPR